MNPALVVQSPPGRPAQLFLLLHGAGADEHSLAPLGRRLGAVFPEARVVCLGGPEADESGTGRQWFSTRAISEENRVDRVTAAMSAFVGEIRRRQGDAGVAASATALIGFSQGAIMALECLRETEPLAARVVAIGGRFAARPPIPPPETTVHLIHGKADPVFPYADAVAAAEWLLAQGADLTADVLPFVGHQIDESVIDTLIERLTAYVPRRIWEDAMKSGQ